MDKDHEDGDPAATGRAVAYGELITGKRLAELLYRDSFHGVGKCIVQCKWLMADWALL